MFSLAEPFRSRAVSRLALVAALSAGMAGCSSDFSRMSENPWASKPQAQAPSNEVTGSVRSQPAHAAPTHRVETSALAAPAPAPSGPTYGGGAGLGSYQPAGRHEVTGSISAPTAPVAPPPRQVAPGWSWDGGTAIIVAQGETIETISRRHRVPAGAILQANGMSHAGLLQPGQRLVIPRLASAPQVSAPQTRVAGPAFAAQPASGNAHVVAPGETIYSLARRYRLTPAVIAKANNLSLAHQLSIGQRIVIPGGAQRVAAPQQAPAPAPVAAAPAQPRQHQQVVRAEPPAAKPPTQKTAQVEPPANARVLTPAADPAPEPAQTGTTGSTNAATNFRWPVRGKVITAFGPKSGGGQNDGINVAVPEGTPIKAAEDGVVAYAGNELKGYGNLVLVRHSNGYVTAYAHASALDVKKGDSVKRGQVIGKAGATGNVTSPQLHFEVRKGATPVDPSQYLTGG